MANPPYGDSSKDPALPTYSTGTFTFNNDNNNDTTVVFTSTASTNQMRTIGVTTSNADWNNGSHGNSVPKAFPGLES